MEQYVQRYCGEKQQQERISVKVRNGAGRLWHGVSLQGPVRLLLHSFRHTRLSYFLCHKGKGSRCSVRWMLKGWMGESKKRSAAWIKAIWWRQGGHVKTSSWTQETFKNPWGNSTWFWTRLIWHLHFDNDWWDGCWRMHLIQSWESLELPGFWSCNHPKENILLLNYIFSFFHIILNAYLRFMCISLSGKSPFIK